jgi:hypothetical protein
LNFPPSFTEKNCSEWCTNSTSADAAHVYDSGDDETTAFTKYGIEDLQQIVAEQQENGNAPPAKRPADERKSPELSDITRFSPDAYQRCRFH